MSYNWEVTEDGYNFETRYVNIDTGQIIGKVFGGKYREFSEWKAMVIFPENKQLGSFVTLEFAQQAVVNQLLRDTKE